MLRFFNSKYIIIFFLSFSSLWGQTIKEKIDSINSIPYQFIVSNLLESNKIFEKNVRDADSINYLAGKGKALYKLALSDYLLGRYDKSTSENLEAIKIFEQTDDYKFLSHLYGEFGYQMKARNIDKAFHYMRMGIDLAKQHGFKETLIPLYNNFGVLFEMTNNLDSAKYYYKKSLELSYEKKDSVSIPYSLNRIAGIYLIQKDFKSALDYVTKSDMIRFKEKGEFGRAENLQLRADIYDEMNELDSAIVYYKKCLKLTERLKYPNLAQYALAKLSNIYEKKNDFKNAFFYFKKATAIRDSINKTETNIKIANLELDYETAKKDKLLAENNLELRKRMSLLILLGALFFFSVIISYFIYRYQKIKRARLQTELELEAQIQKSEFEKRMSDEKLRISRELHDNIGAQLTFLISSLDNLTYSMKEESLVDKLTNISRFGRSALEELRTTIWAMKHEATSLTGLELKLNDMKRHITSANPEIQIDITNNVRKEILLSSGQNLNLYRIAQEAVQNSLKYSKCKKIEIIFDELENGFEFILKDNGCGFNLNEEILKKGNGLKNMEFRCKSAGGIFSIESGESGTRISCSVTTV